jgi:lipopolysaccharide transport system permease protein
MRDEPTSARRIIVSPGIPSWSHELAEIWQFREVLRALVTRDLKVRYRQTVVGMAWILIQPLLLAGLAAVVFGRVVPRSSASVPYPLFTYVGLWLWGFFATALTGAASSLVVHAPLMSKLYLPPALFPTAAVASRLVDLAVGAPVLGAMLVVFAVPLTPRALLVIPLVAVTVVLCLGLGLALAAAMVRFRDVGQALPFVLQVGIFASPILYSSADLPLHLRPWLALNPLTGILEGLRAALFGRSCDALTVLSATVWAALALIVGGLILRAVEPDMVDII